MSSVAGEICPVRGVWLSCGRPCSAVQDATTDDAAPAASGASPPGGPGQRGRAGELDRFIVVVCATGPRRPGYFLEPRRSCSRGPLLLILCRDARRSRGVGGAAVPFAHIAYCRERASPTAAGGCEESAAAQRMMFTGSQRLTIALLTRCTASWRTTVTLV